jgi:hypothetical protein
MTAERLAQLRQRVIFATYHVPEFTPAAERDMLMAADAGEDMLELCDAVVASSYAGERPGRCEICTLDKPRTAIIGDQRICDDCFYRLRDRPKG